MNNKKAVLPVFLLVVAAQLFVPFKMIYDREDVLATGNEHKFKTAPIDPNDPFRGKFITLDYEDNMVEVANAEDWNYRDEVYAILTKDDNGYTRIKSISKVKPPGEVEYVKAKVGFITNDSGKISIDYPFDRYYMEESKAYEAELVYRGSSRDTSQVAYALVNIKNGEAVLKDVKINGQSIREIVKAKQEQY